MRYLIIISTILLSLSANSQRLKIGLFRSWSVKSIDVHYANNEYDVIGDSTTVHTLKEFERVAIKNSAGKLEVLKGEASLGKFDTVRVVSTKLNGHFKVNSTNPWKKPIAFDDDLMILPNSNGTITIINEVEMQNYLGGVIESEGGRGKHLEYYKVQAILSRTYALDHLNKHSKEGFHLCARTHCQAYHHRTKNDLIPKAVSETKGLVMTSAALKLAKGFFHANCGGQTSESDFVWNQAVDYCKSVEDTFCLHSRQATWTKKVSMDKWKNFLVSEYGFPANDSILGSLTYSFNQPSRDAFYHHATLGVPLRDLRKKFGLKSTWFSTRLEGNEVVLEGHGFGHGVGLCQEGAMRMAKLGYSYEQILKYYFTGIHVMNYYDWLFLHQTATVGCGL